MKRKIKPKPINMIMKLPRQEDALNEATHGLLKGRLAGAVRPWPWSFSGM